MRFCSNCGAQIADDALFCSVCGVKVDRNKNDGKATITVSDEPPALPNIDMETSDEESSCPLEIPTNGRVTSVTVSDNPPKENESTPKKVKWPTKILYCVLGLLLPIVIVFIVIWIIGMVNGDNDGEAVNYRPNQIPVTEQTK